MMKAWLLKTKPLMATKGMIAAAKEDAGIVERRVYGRPCMIYATRHYFRARHAVAGVLEVCLYTRERLAEGRREPRFRIFLDYANKDFITWDMEKGKWSRAKISALCVGDWRYNYQNSGRNVAAKGAAALVNRCLKTAGADVEKSVMFFQTLVREGQLHKRHKVTTDMIDAHMSIVPEELPAGWMDFINRKALEGGHCIFFNRETKTGYCTCCRKAVSVPETVRHNAEGKCACGCAITYKSWKRQQRIEYRTVVSIIQRCRDGRTMAYRQFRVFMKAVRSDYYEPQITVHEDYRQLFEIPERTGGAVAHKRGFEWGYFKRTQTLRWCEAGMVAHGYGYHSDNYGYVRSILYTRNLKRLLGGTAIKYVPAAEIIKGVKKRIDVFAVIGDMCMHFPYEAFWKMGLKRFVRERAERGGHNGLANCALLAEKPWQWLQITKEEMRQAARLDASDRMMRIIQLAHAAGARLTDEQALWLDANIGPHELIRHFRLHTPHRIIRYMKENLGVFEGVDVSENLRLWSDYLESARQLGWDLCDRAAFFPQDIRRAHDEAAAELAEKNDSEEAAAKKEKDAIMHGRARFIKQLFRYGNDEYILAVPECWLDFKQEGHAQHNCVATYYEKAVGGGTIIIFIRKRSEPEKPFCTVEVTEGKDGRLRIEQNRAAYNKPAPKEAEEFMKAALKAAQKAADGMRKEAEAQICIPAAV